MLAKIYKWRPNKKKYIGKWRNVVGINLQWKKNAEFTSQQKAKLVLHIKKKKKNTSKNEEKKERWVERMARTLPGKCRSKGRDKRTAINNNR